jgi:hypothetical protein
MLYYASGSNHSPLYIQLKARSSMFILQPWFGSAIKILFH